MATQMEQKQNRTTGEMLTQVPGSIPTKGLVLNIAMHSPVYSLRPVIFAGGAGCPVSITHLVL